jgi:hypothetical protein
MYQLKFYCIFTIIIFNMYITQNIIFINLQKIPSKVKTFNMINPLIRIISKFGNFMSENLSIYKIEC